MELSGSHPTEVCIAYSKLQGDILIKKLETDRFDLLSSKIISNFHFIDSEVDFFFARGNKIGSKILRQIFQDHNFKFLISNSTISTIRFFVNKFFITLKIANNKTETLDLLHSKFYCAPIFFKEDFNKIGQLSLPKRKEFSFLFYPKLLERLKDIFIFSREERLNKQYVDRSVWENEYKKFREIYNIAKMRDMYIEQSDYFSLMQHCLQKTSGTSIIFKFFSRMYHLISDYGQSITRPIIGIFLLFLACTLIFINLGVEKVNAPYLSLTQILKPYSLLYDREPRSTLNNLCKNITSMTENKVTPINNLSKEINNETCQDTLVQYRHGWAFIATSVLESTFSLIFLACLILALRWNFRKA